MSTSHWKWIYNPFEFVAGWKAFFIGLGLLALTTGIGYLGNTVFFALEVKVVPEVTLGAAYLLQALGLAVTASLMYLAALAVARKVRFQDILGCVTLAKYPLLAVALVSLLFGERMAAIDPGQIIGNELPASEYALLIGYGIFALVVLVWEVALLYHAFRVSTNLKGAKCTVTFIAVLLVAEVVTVLLVGSLIN